MVTDPEVNEILEKFYDFLNMASVALTRNQMKIVLKEMLLKLEEMNQLKQNFSIPGELVQIIFWRNWNKILGLS